MFYKNIGFPLLFLMFFIFDGNWLGCLSAGNGSFYLDSSFMLNEKNKRPVILVDNRTNEKQTIA
ncbi:hypothetical protein A1OW_15100 [Enterovibrio norvegicus]|nr:hypothetical protein A1OW_15100 [Enterovibrio norvegicus]